MAASSRARGPIVLAVWLAVTASAVAVVWLGMESVVNAQAGTSPQLSPVDPGGAAGAVLPVDPLGLGAVRPPAVPTTSPSPTPPVHSAKPSSPGRPPSPPPASPPGRGSPSTVSDLHRYSMVGGVVVVQIDGDNVTFVSATPNPGYAVQDWIEDEWLRVDFTSTANTNLIYELYITWNGYSPQVTEDVQGS